jgi:short subunit dehydrogenase-like uncharacterized protein
MTRFDIVIFGATGYTGQFVAREVARQALFENLTWAVAGRSEKKLKKVLETISEEDGKKIKKIISTYKSYLNFFLMLSLFKDVDLSNIEVIILDIINENSVKLMCERAKMVLNCVGPVN